MATKYTHKAGWSVSQVLSGVIPLALAALMWMLFLVDRMSLAGAIILSIFLGGMGAFFLIANARLKNNSALTAAMDDDDDYTIEVWQAKPRPYWNGRLDRTSKVKNKAKLTEVKTVSFGDTEGIPWVRFGFTDDTGARGITVPLRLFIQDKVRFYTISGLQASGKDLSFRDEADKRRFEKLLSEGDDFVEEEVKFDKHGNMSIERAND